MREIKFRAWLPKQPHNQNGRYDYSDDFDDLESYFRNTDGQEQEQYTGLKDKNGREIYEGDIMRSINRDESPSDEVTITERIDIIGSLDIYIDAMNWIPKHGEIIGNIHENPELLQG